MDVDSGYICKRAGGARQWILVEACMELMELASASNKYTYGAPNSDRDRRYS